MDIPPLKIAAFAEKAPENLLLCSDAALVQTCRLNRSDIRVCGECLAQLLVRWFVGDSGEEGSAARKAAEIRETTLDEMIPGGIPPALKRLRVESAGTRLPAPLWEPADARESRLEEILSARLDILLNRTDGFVPVFLEETREAFFIPFELVEAKPGRKASAAEDVAGRPVAGWDKDARQVLGDGLKMVVRFRQEKGLPELSQRSFMLPLQVAAWKRAGDLPRFPAWQLLFTGALDPQGRAEPVRTEEKEAGVKAMFQGDVRLVAPSREVRRSETGGIDPIPAGTGGSDLLESVRRKVEALEGCRLSIAYAQNRLPLFVDELERKTRGEWERQIDRIDRMLLVFGKHGDPETHLRLRMLKSAAYCHAGRTGDARRENRQVHAFAQKHGKVYEQLRLEIEQLVTFQDSQRFEDIDGLSRPLEHRIETADLTREKRLDLRMRLNGTLGQVLMEKALLGLGGKNEPESARARLEKALASARALESADDILQDLNYLHLWHALFEPGGEEERELAREIAARRESLEEREARDKNEGFQARQFAMAAYMAWRRTGDPGDAESLELPPPGCEPWILVSTLRLKGALLAASGRKAAAEKAFSQAEASFTCKPWWGGQGDVLSSGPVLAMIRATLLVQAFCSLRACGAIKEAERHRGLARQMFETYPAILRRVHADRLRAALDAPPPDPRDLPALYY